MILGVTPARGGSKSILKKNIKEIAGKPLIAWTVEKAKKSRLMDRFVVSTEDEEISLVCRQYGAEVIPRPFHLATDDATILSVLQDLLNTIDADIVVILQCTSPVRQDGLIDACITKFLKTGADSLATGFICKLFEWGNYHGRRQDLHGFFHDDGNVYVVKAENIRKGNLWGEKMETLLISPEQNFEIDEIFDFWLNEQILLHRDSVEKIVRPQKPVSFSPEDAEPDDYRNYVIKNGAFIGKFEEMYQKLEDPWHIGDADQMQYDLEIYLLQKKNICQGECRILDIGCGKGQFTSRLKNTFPKAKILATDISETAIKKAQQNNHDLDIEFRTHDIRTEYQNLKEQFDLVIVSQVIWYILPEFPSIIEHIKKNVLNKDGTLLINLTFYQPGTQTYGNEVLSDVKNLCDLVGMEVIEMIEMNRFQNSNAIVLFKNKR
jgi:N-acylneuraminate cytidylyltransferase